jgi:leucyl-tRNA synthetase
VVTSVPSDSPDDFATLTDLKKKAAYFNIKDEWVKDFEPIPIIETPSFGNMAAVRVCEEMKINSPKDRVQLAAAKEKVYKEGFYSGKMVIGDYAGKTVQEAKPLIRQQMIERNEACPYWEPENIVMSRSGDECVVCLTDQWYLNYGEESWKQDAQK